MGESVATRQFNFQTSPRVGQILVAATNTTPLVIPIPASFFNRYITLFNDSVGTNIVYYVVGPPGSTPVPNPATTGGLGTTGLCQQISNGDGIRVRFRSGIDGVLAIVGATNIVLRMYPSSNQEGYALGNPPGQP